MAGLVIGNPKRVSRGFNRLAIFIALLTLFAFLVISATKYDPATWWIGGVFAALCMYGLTRLLGWAINGFSDGSPVDSAPAVANSPTVSSDPSVFSAPERTAASQCELTRDVQIPSDALVQPPNAVIDRLDGTAKAKPEPKGIGGWLYLPALGVILSPLWMIKGAFDLIKAANDLPIGAPALIRSYIWGSAAVNVAQMAAWIYAIQLMRKHRASFTKYYSTLLGVSLVVLVLDAVIASSAFQITIGPDDVKGIVRTAVVAVIWIPYMFVSKRVRNTFVN